MYLFETDATTETVFLLTSAIGFYNLVYMVWCQYILFLPLVVTLCSVDKENIITLAAFFLAR